MDLDLLRQQINYIDSELLSLLAKRFKCCLQIRTLKDKIEDKYREKELKNIWQEESKKHGLSLDFSIQLLNLILDESKRLQQSDHEN